MNEHFFIYNGTYFQQEEPVINAGNHALRYGVGLFETMQMHKGKIWNTEFHFERFFSGMKILKLNVPDFFSKEFFLKMIDNLVLKNSYSGNVRIRLMSFRENVGLLDTNNQPGYIIEAWQLSEKIELNEKGWVVDVFKDAKKGCDQFSNLKSNNYLLSVMAGLFAKSNQLDEAIVLNTYGRVCESAIANIFIIKEDMIYTPPLPEGCVAGTMRRWMLEKFSLKNYRVIEKKLETEDLLQADELFLTNSINLIRWVEKFRHKKYNNKKTTQIFEQVKKEMQMLSL